MEPANHISETLAAHPSLDSNAGPTGNPSACSTVPPPISEEPLDINEAVSDNKAYLARGFLNDLAPMVAPYREEKELPEEFWERVVSFVSDTNGGLSPELNEVVERCRKHKSTSA